MVNIFTDKEVFLPLSSEEKGLTEPPRPPLLSSSPLGLQKWGGGKAPDDDIIEGFYFCILIFFLIKPLQTKRSFFRCPLKRKDGRNHQDLHSEVLLPEVSSSGGGKAPYNVITLIINLNSVLFSA